MTRKMLFVLVGLLALLMVGGCSCKQGQGTWDCLKEKVGAIVEQVCGFNINDSQTSQDGVNFISAVAPMVGTVFGVSINAEQAKAALTQVVNLAARGGCMAVQDLQEALKFVDKLTDQYNQLMNTKSTKLKGLKELPAPPDMTLLRYKAGMK